MLIGLFAAALALGAGQTAPVTTVPAPAAPAPRIGAQPETRRVCSYETVTGSNLRTRVCRNVSRHPAQSEETREFMRSNQHTHLPDLND